MLDNHFRYSFAALYVCALPVIILIAYASIRANDIMHSVYLYFPTLIIMILYCSVISFTSAALYEEVREDKIVCSTSFRFTRFLIYGSLSATMHWFCFASY